MARRDFSRSFGADSMFADEEDADPRVGLVNLADVMLVFACGLMLALVSFWNLDVSAMSEVTQSDSVMQIDDPEKVADVNGGSGYVDMGRVYMDPESGKMYMEDDSGKGGATSSSANEQSASEQSTSG